MSDAMARIGVNVGRMRALLKQEGIGAVVSSRPEDAAYLTPIRAFLYRTLAEGRMSEVVILRADGWPVLVTMDAYVPYYRSVGVDARGLSDLTGTIAALTADLDTIAIPAQCPWELRTTVASNTGARVVDADPLLKARSIKSDLEIGAMSEAAGIAGAGMRAMLSACRPGVSEMDVAGCGEFKMRSLGAESSCFSMLVISGPELGLMREVTSTRMLSDGDWVMIDGGCSIAGYNAEFARTVRVGGPDELFSRVYRAVYEAQQAAIGSIRAGVTGSEVDALARRIISDAGFGNHCYSHITGHGIGTGVWELPVIGPDSHEPLPAGAVVSVEPGIFIPDVGGVRIEDLVLVTVDGSQVLTDAPLVESALDRSNTI